MIAMNKKIEADTNVATPSELSTTMLTIREQDEHNSKQLGVGSRGVLESHDHRNRKPAQSKR